MNIKDCIKEKKTLKKKKAKVLKNRKITLGCIFFFACTLLDNKNWQEGWMAYKDVISSNHTRICILMSIFSWLFRASHQYFSNEVRVDSAFWTGVSVTVRKQQIITSGELNIMNQWFSHLQKIPGPLPKAALCLASTRQHASHRYSSQEKKNIGWQAVGTILSNNQMNVPKNSMEAKAPPRCTSLKRKPKPFCISSQGEPAWNQTEEEITIQTN